MPSTPKATQRQSAPPTCDAGVSCGDGDSGGAPEPTVCSGVAGMGPGAGGMCGSPGSGSAAATAAASCTICTIQIEQAEAVVAVQKGAACEEVEIEASSAGHTLKHQARRMPAVHEAKCASNAGHADDSVPEGHHSAHAAAAAAAATAAGAPVAGWPAQRELAAARRRRSGGAGAARWAAAPAAASMLLPAPVRQITTLQSASLRCTCADTTTRCTDGSEYNQALCATIHCSGPEEVPGAQSHQQA